MKRILILFTIHYSLLTFLSAGITDFEAIDEAKKAYEAKQYTRSEAFLNKVDAKSSEKRFGESH